MNSKLFATDWFKHISVKDELHIVALDNLLLNSPGSQVKISGVTKIDQRWSPTTGDHSIIFSDGATMLLSSVTDSDNKTRIYKTESSGTTAIKNIYRILNAKRIVVQNDSFIRAIDNYLLKKLKLLETGSCIIDTVVTPMPGIYTVNEQDGYIIIKVESTKQTKKYTIDLVGTQCSQQFMNLLNGNIGRIRVINCSVFLKRLDARATNKPPLPNMFPGQTTIVEKVVEMYNNSANKNVSILVSGTSGLGKSTIGFLIAQKLKNDFGIDPYLIKGFNITCDVMQYHPLIAHYSPDLNTPIVLLLDEFDIAINRAENGDPDGVAIASNKSNLNGFLDSIGEESYLITVATTNVPLNDMVAQYPVYCRRGRFHKHFTMINQNETQISEPN